MSHSVPQTVTEDQPTIPGRSRTGLSAHLARLEAESIYILREAAAEFERPTILYSIGKDSSVLLHLAIKAFSPCPLPFSLLHVGAGRPRGRGGGGGPPTVRRSQAGPAARTASPPPRSLTDTIILLV